MNSRTPIVVKYCTVVRIYHILGYGNPFAIRLLEPRAGEVLATGLLFVCLLIVFLFVHRRQGCVFCFDLVIKGTKYPDCRR